MQNKSKELETAILAALEAGKVLEKYFETEILKDLKEDNSIVTLADKEAEDVIKNIIFRAFPEHSLVGEETGHTKNNGKYTWYIDPLDGTKNLSNGIPLFAVSIALECDGELLVGVIHNPITRSLFYAEKNKGSYLNEKRIYVSKDDATHSMISGGKSRKDEDRKLCRRLMHDLPIAFKGSTVRDFGAVALDLAYVARGGLEVNIQLGLYTYDFAAGALLVQEAGGRITNLDGSPWKFPENHFIASNGVFHDLLVEEIQRIKNLAPKA